LRCSALFARLGPGIDSQTLSRARGSAQALERGAKVAAHDVIVQQAHGPHEGVDRGRPDDAETAPLQAAADVEA
jgi:hypothetical protein